MSRKRSPKRKKAYEIWLANNGDITNREIGEILGVSMALISKWRREDDWESTINEKTFYKRCSTNEDFKKERMLPKKSLNEKQQLFCLYYLQSFNATLSYKRAYGCKYTTAQIHGYLLIHKPEVKEFIDYLRDIQAKTLLARASDVVEMYMRIAFANINQIVLIQNKPIVIEGKLDGYRTELNIANSDDMDGQIISEIKSSNNGISVKLNDRMKALQWLSDYFELNPKDQHKKDYDNKMLVIKEKQLEGKEDWG